MKKKDLQTAQTYKSALLDLGIPIEKVIVFGSKANGKSNRWSDLDICVVSSLFDVDRQAERSLLLSVKRKVSNDIEPHPFTEEGLKDKFNPLANEIRKYGLAI